MLPTERILRKMDALYDRAVDDPDNEQLRGELLGLAEALVIAHQSVTVDDLRQLMAERYEQRHTGAHRRVPTIRRLVNQRLTATDRPAA